MEGCEANYELSKAFMIFYLYYWKYHENLYSDLVSFIYFEDHTCFFLIFAEDLFVEFCYNPQRNSFVDVFVNTSIGKLSCRWYN